MNFTAFQQSAFLQSLGWAIANSVWQAGICWILYYTVVSSYNTPSSRVKNNVSTIFLFTTFLWFVSTFINKFIYLQNNIPGTIQKQTTFSTDFHSVSSDFGLRNFIHAAGITLPYLSIAYLLLLLIFTVKLINSYRNTIFIRYNGLKKPGVEWKLFVENVAGQMGINKKIRLWFSKHVDVPATIGFLKPVILIPLALLNQLTAAQLEAIILHELSHIKRNDYLINLFISLIETVLFFNPFIVLLSKIIKKERENCCDDFVLQYKYDRHSYASALLSLEKYRIQNLHLALTAASGKKQLLSRIKRIMQEVRHNNKSLNYGQKLVALLLTTGIICSIAWLSPARRSNQSLNSKQLSGKNLGATNPKINKEKNIFLLSKDGVLENPDLHSKIIKDKSIALTDISKKNNSVEKKAALFTWKFKGDEIENNPKLTDAYTNNGVTAPNLPASEASADDDNVFFLPQFSIPDLKFLQNLNFYMDMHKLESEMERSGQSFSSINWDNLEQEIIKNLKKIKMAPLKVNIEKNKIVPGIDKLEQERSIQEEVQFSFIRDNLSNIPNWNIRSRPDDSLFLKDLNSSANDKDGFFLREIDGNNLPTPAPPPEKRNRTIKTSPQIFNNTPVSSGEDNIPAIYLTHKEKLPTKQSIHINYKNGSVIINGKKIHELKKYQAQAIVKKILLACDHQMAEIRIED